MARQKRGSLPQEVSRLAEEILSLASRDGISHSKVSKCGELLAEARRRDPSVSGPQLVDATIDMITNAVIAKTNGRDRLLLTVGLNLDHARPEHSPRQRILRVLNLWDKKAPGFLTDEGALDRFRNVLVNRLAWQITGRRNWSPARSDLDLAQRYLNQGRTGEAIHLYERVANDNDRAPEERVQAWQELSGIEFDQSEVTDAVIAAENAIDSSTATESSVYLEPLMTYLDRLAGRLTHLEHYDLAKRVMEYALPRFPNSGLLWRRLGCVQWYNDEPIAAFASLSTALNNGEDRSHVIHERGQVLAEMGRFREAIAELTEDLNYERSSESAAFARSTRAYAYGMLGEMDFALKEFSSAEQVTPENAWLQYFRALCYHQQNMDDVCVRGLHAALSDQLPPLNKAKRDWAIKLLKELEPRCD